MKSIILSVFFILISSMAYTCDTEEQCLFGDAIIQYAGDTIVVDCISYNRNHDKWEFNIDGDTYLVSTETSKVWTMDGQLIKEKKNGKYSVRVKPSHSFFILNKDMSESPIFVDSARINGDTIVAHSKNSKGQNFMTIYPVSQYDAFTSEGDKVLP